MSRNPSISLTDHQQAFVTKLVASGRFHGVSEVMRAGLRLLEEREERRQALLKRIEVAVQEGLDSGPAVEMEEIEDILAQAKAELESTKA